jgi:hypothetical protein
MGYMASLRFRAHKKAPSATTITFQTDKMAKDEIVRITSACVSDFTTANKKLVLGIRTLDGNDHYFETVQETSTFGIHLTGKIMLVEGERLIGIVTSPTQNDECYFTVDGDRYSVMEK